MPAECTGGRGVVAIAIVVEADKDADEIIPLDGQGEIGGGDIGLLIENPPAARIDNFDPRPKRQSRRGPAIDVEVEIPASQLVAREGKGGNVVNIAELPAEGRGPVALNDVYLSFRDAQPEAATRCRGKRRDGRDAYRVISRILEEERLISLALADRTRRYQCRAIGIEHLEIGNEAGDTGRDREIDDIAGVRGIAINLGIPRKAQGARNIVLQQFFIEQFGGKLIGPAGARPRRVGADREIEDSVPR